MFNKTVFALAALVSLTTLGSAKSDDSAVIQLKPVDPATVGMSAEKLAEINPILDGLIAKKKLAGAVVLVSKDGNIVHLKSYGYRNITDEHPMTDDTIFRIYSMTKAITSATALMLVDEGAIKLDDPIGKYISAFRDISVHTKDGDRAPKRAPTVRDLLRHTSGLTYGIFGDSAVDKMYRKVGVLSPADDLKTFAAKVGALPLEYDPGTSWKYSVASDVLGRVIEVATDKPLDKVFAERIFQPLGMVDTGFYVPAEKLNRFATTYTTASAGSLLPSDLPATSAFARPKPFLSGGGGLVSTIRDYHRFLLMIAGDGEFHGKRLLSKESVQLMTTNQLPNEVKWIRFDEERTGVGFGLGFSVRVSMSDWDAGSKVGEYGWGGAASTHYWVSPTDNLIVITMEQVMPYSFSTEWAIKKTIYDAID